MSGLKQKNIFIGLLAIAGFAYFILTASQAEAAISLVQSTSSATAVGTSTTASFANTTAGNLIIVAAETRGGSTMSVSDSAGNTFTEVKTVTFNFTISRLSLYYAANIVGGADTVKLVDNGTSGSAKHLHVFEYSGLATVSPLDQSTTSVAVAGSGLSIATGFLTTTNASELLFAAAGTAGQTETFTAGSGYTLEKSTTIAGDSSFGSEDRTVVATGSYNASTTWNNAIGGTSGAMVFGTFKAAAAAPASRAVKIRGGGSGRLKIRGGGSGLVKLR